MAHTLIAKPFGGILQISSQALEASVQVSVNNATLFSILGVNTGPDQYIQIWDANASNDAGAQQLYFFPIPAGLPYSLDTQIIANRGIFITNASTATSATPTTNVGSADNWFVARFN